MTEQSNQLKGAIGIYVEEAKPMDNVPRTMIRGEIMSIEPGSLGHLPEDLRSAFYIGASIKIQSAIPTDQVLIGSTVKFNALCNVRDCSNKEDGNLLYARDPRSPLAFEGTDESNRMQTIGLNFT